MLFPTFYYYKQLYNKYKLLNRLPNLQRLHEYKHFWLRTVTLIEPVQLWVTIGWSVHPIGVASWFPSLITILWTGSWHQPQVVRIIVSPVGTWNWGQKWGWLSPGSQTWVTMELWDGYLIHEGQKCSHSWLAETKEWDRPTERRWETESGYFPKMVPGSSFQGPSYIPALDSARYWAC